jgi:hypothetical protein
MSLQRRIRTRTLKICIYEQMNLREVTILEVTAEENIWTEDKRSNRRFWNLHNEELHNLYSSANIIRMIT